MIRKPISYLDKAEAKARFEIETKKITQKHQNVLNRDITHTKKVFIVVPEIKASQSQQVLPELPYILATS